MQHFQRRAVLVGAWGCNMGIGAKEEVERMAVEVFAKEAALEIWKHMAESCRSRLREAGRAGEMLNEHGAGETVFAGTRVVGPYLGGHADVGLFLEPENAEDASAVPQLGEERLDGVDDMQELEAV